MSVLMTLSDFKRRDARGQIFKLDLYLKTLVPFDIERPNLAE